MDNLEIAHLMQGGTVGQIPTTPQNLQLFNEALNEWETYAQTVAGATDPLLGKQPPAGTPFRLQERVVFEGKGLHEYRQGKYAKFIEEMYRDWIIPYMAKEIVKGKKFLANLTGDEMQWLMERVSASRARKAQIDAILDGELPADFEMLKQIEAEKFMKRGSQQFIEILKDELKDIHLKVKVTVGSKQKDLALQTDKIVNVIRQYLTTPQLLRDPTAMKLLNRVLELSGLSPVDFSAAVASLQGQKGTSEQSTKPIKELSGKQETMV